MSMSCHLYLRHQGGVARVEMRSNCWQHESTSPLLNTAIICKLGSAQQQLTLLLLLHIALIIDTDAVQQSKVQLKASIMFMFDTLTPELNLPDTKLTQRIRLALYLYSSELFYRYRFNHFCLILIIFSCCCCM